MITTIQAQGFSITDAIDQHVRCQLGSALRNFHGDVTRGDVYLRDLNGPKGGGDKCATIRVALRGLPPVTVASRAHDLYAAVSDASRRARRATQRCLRRQRRFSRVTPRRQPLASDDTLLA